MESQRVAILSGRAEGAGRHPGSRVLRQAGFDVIELPLDADPSALSAASPDVVVLDGAGEAAASVVQCQRLRADSSTAGVPILLLSGEDPDDDARAAGLEGGADAYLVQPAAPRELVANLNALLRSRQVEEAVRRSEERFRLLVGATARVVWSADSDGGLVHAEGWTELTGQPEVEAHGSGWLNAVHALDRSRVANAWSEAVRGRTPYKCEYRMRVRDGSDRHFSARGVPLLESDGSFREWAGICIDVHERTRAEEVQHFLADAGAVLAVTLDPDETLSRVAELAIPMLGDACSAYLVSDDGLRSVVHTHLDAAKQKIADELERRFPLDRGGVRGVAAVIRSGEPLLVPDVSQGSATAASLNLDHARLVAELNIQSLLTVPLVARGQTLGALAFVTSAPACGEPRRLGQAELQLAQDLARRVALAVDNARLYQTALVASEAKSNFLAVMSHELRTPMNAIIGYSELLGDQLAGPLLPKQLEQVERIQASSRHLLQLINEVLAFARIEAGREELHLEVVDLYHLASDTASLIAPMAQLKNLPLCVDVPAGCACVRTDAGKVRQILLNLLSNAVKFTEQGEVSLSARISDGTAVLEVRDTGSGIAASQMQKIFDPFWQVEQTSTRRTGGTGLGLSVTRQLVALLGGEILVESVEGHGSSFVIRIPAPSVS